MAHGRRRGAGSGAGARRRLQQRFQHWRLPPQRRKVGGGPATLGLGANVRPCRDQRLHGVERQRSELAASMSSVRPSRSRALTSTPRSSSRFRWRPSSLGGTARWPPLRAAGRQALRSAALRRRCSWRASRNTSVPAHRRPHRRRARAAAGSCPDRPRTRFGQCGDLPEQARALAFTVGAGVENRCTRRSCREYRPRASAACGRRAFSRWVGAAIEELRDDRQIGNRPHQRRRAGVVPHVRIRAGARSARTASRRARAPPTSAASSRRRRDLIDRRALRSQRAGERGAVAAPNRLDQPHRHRVRRRRRDVAGERVRPVRALVDPLLDERRSAPASAPRSAASARRTPCRQP